MNKPAVLAIDVGNTRIKCGLLGERNEVVEKATAIAECIEVIAIPINSAFDFSDVEKAIANQDVSVHRCVVSGSNPQRMEAILSVWPEGLPQPTKVVSPLDLQLKINVDEPEAVGLDRVLNALAANQIRKPDQSAIVIDSGTATTVDLIDANGAFAGGTILPGIELSAKALHHYTALLPLISMNELRDDLQPPGENTRDAIQNGILFGHIGAIREIVRQLNNEANSSLLILTGGAGQMLARHLPEARYIPYLSLRALAAVD